KYPWRSMHTFGSLMRLSWKITPLVLLAFTLISFPAVRAQGTVPLFSPSSYHVHTSTSSCKTISNDGSVPPDPQIAAGVKHDPISGTDKDSLVDMVNTDSAIWQASNTRCPTTF